MKIKITSFSTYALSILCSCGHGFIHSVYRKTVNIQIGASLLALQSSPSPQSPLSLMTELTSDQIESLSFLPGQRVEVMPEEICIFTGTNVFCFDCSGASVFDSLLLPCSHLSWTRFCGQRFPAPHLRVFVFSLQIRKKMRLEISFL